MKKILIFILILGVIAGVYFVLTKLSRKSESATTQTQTIPTKNPEKFKAETIGFELEATRLIRLSAQDFASMEYSLSRDLTQDDIYVKAYSLKAWSDLEFNPDIISPPYDSYEVIKSFSDGQSCNAIIPLYGIALNDSCRILITNAGARLVTGFFGNRHGEPPFVAFFITKRGYGVLLIQFYREESKNINFSYLASRQEEFVSRIQAGEFPEISNKIENFKNILRTVKLSE